MVLLTAYSYGRSYSLCKRFSCSELSCKLAKTEGRVEVPSRDLQKVGLGCPLEFREMPLDICVVCWHVEG